MDCETKRPQQQQTALRRPVLLRVERAASANEANEQCHRALAVGFDGIELVLDPQDVRSIWVKDVEADLETCAGEGSPRPSKTRAVAARCSATNVAMALDEVTSLMARAVLIEARCLNLRIPSLMASPADEGFHSSRDAINFAYKLLQGVRFEAEAAGVAVALEAGTGRTLLSPVELCDIIDAANSWAVGACIDVATVAQFGCPADWIRTLGRRTHTVRVHDAFGDWPAIAAALDEIRYAGVVMAAGDLKPEQLRGQLSRSI